MPKAKAAIAPSANQNATPTHGLQPLQQDRHQHAGLKKQESYAFARSKQSVVISMHEIEQASKYYPIVFTNTAQPMPQVVLGLDRQNAFVNADGQWRHGCYIPVTISKYPFSLLPVPTSDNLALCIDENADRYQAKKPDLPFYDGANPSEMLKQKLELCRDHMAKIEATRIFSAALNQAGLLEQMHAKVNLKGGGQKEVSGFLALSYQKVQALSAAERAKWQEQKWDLLAQMVINSQVNWSALSA